MNSKNITYQFKNVAGRGINRGHLFIAGNILMNVLIVFIISVLVPNNSTLTGIIVSLLIWILGYDLFLSKHLKKGLAILLSTRRAKTGRTHVINLNSVVGLIVGTSFILFLILTQYINWHDFFNYENLSNSDFNKAVFLVFTVFSLRILFLLFSTIFNTKILTKSYDQLIFISTLLTSIIILLLLIEVSGYLAYLRITIYSAPIILFFFSISILLRQKIKAIQPVKID